MKILLMGENSGVYRYLKQGVQELGHEVTLASNGDGWKKISGRDVSLYTVDAGASALQKVKNYLLGPILDQRFHGFDIVQAVSPGIYHWAVCGLLFKRLKENNGRLFISISGLYYHSYQCWKNGDYGIYYQMFYDSPQLLASYENNGIKARMVRSGEDRIFHMADGLIPVIPFEYELPFKKFGNLREAIPLPLNVGEIMYKPNKVMNGKIVFLHSINSVESKGSSLMIEAMRIIENKYKGTVKCIVVERLPYEEYTALIDSANVIMDQCKSYGYGMNALIAMAKGKIVLSGAEEPVFYNIAKEECPVVNIIPDIGQIVEAMESVIERKHEFEEIGEMGRKFVEKYHDHVAIAEKYIEEWKKSDQSNLKKF